MRGVSNNLFKSYLENRSQVVRINQIYSEKLPIEFGVPQGSVLGPILFNIYINNLFNIDTRGDIIGFADDTVILYTANTWLELKETAESDFLKIHKWLKYKILTLNVEKTCYLPFYCNNLTSPTFSQLKINAINNSYEINAVNAVKYLGVFLDSNMKWDIHIKYVCKKLRSLLSKFRYLTNVLTLNQLTILYYSLIESHIRYGLAAWGGALKTYIHPLQVLQKYHLKIIYKKNRRFPSDELFNISKVLEVRQLYYKKIVTHYHYKKNIYIFPIHDHNTRQKQFQILPLMQKAIGQRSYAFVGPKFYNRLPEDIKEINNNYKFKKKLNKYVSESGIKFITNLLE